MGFATYLKRGIRYVLKGVPENKLTVNIRTVEPGDLLRNRNIIVTGGGRGLGVLRKAQRFLSREEKRQH